jgi:hypothetical protein
MRSDRSAKITLLLLIGSAALNVGGGALVAGGHLSFAAPRSAARAGTSTPARPETAPTLPVAAADDAREYARWLALGLREDEAAQLLLARLAADERAARRQQRADYWRPAPTADNAAIVAAQLDTEAAVRARLESVLGPRAKSMAALASVYRPHDDELGFLASDEQLAVRRLRLERVAAPADPGNAESGRGADSRGPRDGRGELDALRALLPADRALEVALRASPLAAQLRASGVAFTENEFRTAFGLLADDGATADPARQLERRAALATLLGPRRFNRVWSQLDPLAAVVRRVGTALGLRDAAIEQTYAVLNEAQGRLLEVALRGGDVERLAAAAQEIASAERRDLEGAIGAEAAGDVLAARSEFLATTARTPPPGQQQ